VDWNRDLSDLRVANPKSESFVLSAGQTKTLFDGTRSLALDVTTNLSVALVAGETDRYRFRHTSGADPLFRTDRALDLDGATIDVVVNANSTATLDISGGSFAGVQVSDIVWIPGAEESVTSPFDAVNRGFWVVLAADNAQLVLGRENEENFEAFGETAIAITDAGQFVAFSSNGVQIGDKLEVSAGFAASTLRTYPVVDVTSKYIEVTSGAIIPGQSGIAPNVAGFQIYTSSKSFVYLEADQDCVIRANGDTGSTQRVSPWIAADDTKVGSYERTGPTWSMAVVNRSSRPLNLTVITCE